MVPSLPLGGVVQTWCQLLEAEMGLFALFFLFLLLPVPWSQAGVEDEGLPHALVKDAPTAAITS